MHTQESISALPPFLQALNAAQLEAVLHPHDIPLQILAGPGSGKTKVLTSRIAYMIQTALSPWPTSAVWALTFSNKAAKEMSERLRHIGIQNVTLGTFHSVCALLLRKHGRKVGVDPSFTICDSNDSKKIISAVLHSRKDNLERLDCSIKESTVASMISSAKSRGEPTKILWSSSSLGMGANASQVLEVLSEVATAYNQALRDLNALDFDDLLVFGVGLVKDHPVVDIRHLFVDEFQDTNLLQLELMLHLAPHGRITIVGDPDQSIYGWRSAEIGNLGSMITRFPDTKQIMLVENYRSTQGILELSSAIISQDTQRIARPIHTSISGRLPSWQCFKNDIEEANYMASEIKRQIAATGSLLDYGDFAILIRVSSLSRIIESALQKEGIPHRVLGSHKFFDRVEIKDVLAHLTIIGNSRFLPAWTRCLQRVEGIGEKTAASLLSNSERLQLEPLTMLEQVCDGTIAAKPASLRHSLGPFLHAVKTLRHLADTGTSAADLIRQLLVLLNYGATLKKAYKDWASRIENLNELISFAQSFDDTDPFANTNDTLPVISPGDEKSEQGPSPLQRFLEKTTLSTDTQQSGTTQGASVTIATCHSAKGLEWGVVMVPAVETGIYPSYRSEDSDEERRLLYVACTRAQGLLYLSCAQARMLNGSTSSRQPSIFVKPILDSDISGRLVSKSIDHPYEVQELRKLAQVLRRDLTANHETAVLSYSTQRSIVHHVRPDASPHDVTNMVGFTSARAASGHSANSLTAAFIQPTSSIILPSGQEKAITQREKTSSLSPPLFPRKRKTSDSFCSETQSTHPKADTRGAHPKPPVLASAQCGPQNQGRTPATKAVDITANLGPALSSRRRLGMGHTGGGYTNKKFKSQTQPRS